ncbi:MAG TPA: acyl-CoA desaturase, partial [Candidatus Saccharimonadia bacterium]|nr:acyl-CoA desaturase [Candidatus Saccharimonadia bacterium]
MTAGPTAARREGSDYAQLTRLVRDKGLLNGRPGYYTAKIVLTLGLFLAVWPVLHAIGGSWLTTVLAAAFLAVMSSQIGFIGHDAGHRQIVRSARTSKWLGLVFGNLFLGLSEGWWDDKHLRHHLYPNNSELDPDVAPGALKFFREDAVGLKGVEGFMARNQHRLFFPLLLLEGWNLHWASVQAVRNPELASRRVRNLEKVLLLIHTVLYVGATFIVLPWAQAIVFILVHQALWGVFMGVSFAPNHKGMPTLTAAQEKDFLRRQVLTSRNLRGAWWYNWVITFFFGGLDLQIEHHLWQSMPRPNLRRA